MNSGPLSTRIILGKPLTSFKYSKTLIKRSVGSDRSASIASTSRLKSSIMFSNLNLLPSQRLSTHEIYRPNLIDRFWPEQSLFNSGRQSFTVSSANIQLEAGIYPVDSLVVPGITHSSHSVEALPETNAGMLLHKSFNCSMIAESSLGTLCYEMVLLGSCNAFQA